MFYNTSFSTTNKNKNKNCPNLFGVNNLILWFGHAGVINLKLRCNGLWEAWREDCGGWSCGFWEINQQYWGTQQGCCCGGEPSWWDELMLYEVL